VSSDTPVSIKGTKLKGKVDRLDDDGRNVLVILEGGSDSVPFDWRKLEPENVTTTLTTTAVALTIPAKSLETPQKESAPANLVTSEELKQDDEVTVDTNVMPPKDGIVHSIDGDSVTVIYPNDPRKYPTPRKYVRSKYPKAAIASPTKCTSMETAYNDKSVQGGANTKTLSSVHQTTTPTSNKAEGPGTAKADTKSSSDSSTSTTTTSVVTEPSSKLKEKEGTKDISAHKTPVTAPSKSQEAEGIAKESVAKSGSESTPTITTVTPQSNSLSGSSSGSSHSLVGGTSSGSATTTQQGSVGGASSKGANENHTT